MKKLHIIHVKDAKDIKRIKGQGKILPVLEETTLDWAKLANDKAYQATVQVKEDLRLGKAPANKYFRYLRRLLEMRMEEAEEIHEDAYPKPPNYLGVPDSLLSALDIESLRIPQHISCTQLDMWNSCKMKWYWRYAKGIKTPKTAALHFGVAVDEALNFYFGEIKEGRKPPRASVHASFHEWFDKDKKKVIWGEANPTQLYKNGPAIIDAYLDEFDDKTEIFDVQTEIKIKLDNNGLIIGAIDILEKNAVVDTKTAKEKWKTEGKWAKHRTALQPRAYSLWFYEEYGKMPGEFRYQVVTKETDAKGRPTPQTQMIAFSVKRYEVEEFKRNAQKAWDEMNEAVKIGKSAFPAAANDKRVSPLCCHKYCDYSDLCQSEGLRIASHWDKKNKCHVYED
jgi:hypothetical protein